MFGEVYCRRVHFPVALISGTWFAHIPRAHMESLAASIQESAPMVHWCLEIPKITSMQLFRFPAGIICAISVNDAAHCICDLHLKL